ncbi:MAG: right-handed parallel beta-helix repeat-containing protein [Candidatus Aenigmarchaeota archaeon]|nr:right-handed parallel beta-helix repeat-containing protein [Candidatus Aenigmarchaeota archaeon]
MAPITENGLVVWQRPVDADTEIKAVSSDNPGAIKDVNPGLTDSVSSFIEVDNGYVLWKRCPPEASCELRVYNFSADSNVRIDDTGVDDAAQFPLLENGKAIWLNPNTTIFPQPGVLSDLWLWNGASAMLLARNVTKGCAPLLQDGQVVWLGWDGNDRELFIFDGSRVAQLTNNSAEEGCFSVHDGKVAWPSYDGNDFEIMLFDRINISRITNDTLNDTGPSLFDGKIAWTNVESYSPFGAPENTNVKLFDGTSVNTIFDTDYQSYDIQLQDAVLFKTTNPTVSVTALVYYNITSNTTTFLSTDFGSQIFRGNRVAWRESLPNGDQFIGFFDGNAPSFLDFASGSGNAELFGPEFDGRHVAWIRKDFQVQSCTPAGGTAFDINVPHDSLKTKNIISGSVSTPIGAANTYIDPTFSLDDGIASWIGDDTVTIGADCSVNYDFDPFLSSFSPVADPKAATPYMMIGNESMNVTVSTVLQNDGGKAENGVPVKVSVNDVYSETKNVDLPPRALVSVNFTLPFSQPDISNITISFGLLAGFAESNSLNNKAGLVSFQGNVTDGHNHSLPGINVTFSLNGKRYRTHSDSNGTFNIITNHPATSGDWLSVALADGRGFVEVYDWIGSQANPTYFGKNLTAISFAGRIRLFNASNQTDFQQPIGFHNSSAVDRLDDLAWIYYFDKITADFTNDALQLSMNFSMPVEIYGFRPGGGSLFYCSHNISSCNFSAKITKINSPVARTALTAAGMPDVHMHEFGHHIQADSLMGGDNKGITIGGTNHGLIANPDSRDSWVEGFAQFVPLAVKRVALNDSQANLLKWSGSAAGDDMERNYNVTEDEEFAVSSLMWDLLDGTTNAAPDLFGDNVQLTIQQIWGTINKEEIINISAVYKAFNSSGFAGLSGDADVDNITNLDEIFVAHGFYNDSNGNGIYDLGEPIGITSWNPAFQEREEKLVRPGSFLSFTVINTSGNQTFEYEILVNESNSPPFDSLDRQYAIPASNDTLINGTLTPYSMPPTESFTKGNLTVFVDGVNCGSVELNNTFYWGRVAASTDPPEALISKVFFCDGEPPQAGLCGANITADTNLSQDIACSGTALSIGASGITIDCQGHALAGNGSGDGIHIEASNVAVKNCIIRGFGSGINILGGNNYSIANNTLLSNTIRGLGIVGSDSNVTSNTVYWNQHGMGFSGVNNWIAGNNVSGNRESGIAILTSANSTIQDNVAVNNSNYSVYVSDSIGSMIRGNVVQQSSVGIFHTISSSSAISDNIVVLNGKGISMFFSDGNNITGNTVQGNSLGIELEFFCQGNRIFNNYFSNSVNANDTTGANLWNTTRRGGTNIIGNPLIGGNFWDDYAGFDFNGDLIGDTGLPYKSGGRVVTGGDFLPLVMHVCGDSFCNGGETCRSCSSDCGICPPSSGGGSRGKPVKRQL